ncbi:hypothetical protein lerEdw1_000175 [Lerista edwardsae]|nr:hypothetical protein lerEdw1_000175 [Lerista edwardsae]
MSREKNDEPPTDHEKNELFSFSGDVSELMMAHAKMKHEQKKHFKEMAFMESHASLFHIIQSVIKSWRKTAKPDNLQSRIVGQISFHVPQDAVSKKAPSRTIDKRGSKDASKLVHSKRLSVPENQRVVLGRQQKPLGELSAACMLPYLVLLHRSIPLPISDIKSRCLKGEILCRIQYFTLRRSKRRLLPQPTSSKLHIPKPETTKAKYVTFDSLRDLQWKLYKGLLKRKPKVTGTWRVPCFSTGSVSRVAAFEEFILPLIPKDWIIDDSLQYIVPLPISAHILNYESPAVREWGAVTDILGTVLTVCTDDSQSWDEVAGG